MDTKEYANGLLLFNILDDSSFIGRITINNPKKRNALSQSMWFGISEIFNDCMTIYKGIRVLIITGQGSIAFSSGADLSEKEPESSTNLNKDTVPKIREKIRQFPIPIIAQIDGFCLGGGLALAMCTDFRFASVNASFSIPAVHLGIACPPDIVHRLVELVGESQAKMILYQGTRITGQQAFSIGLIQRLSENSEQLAADVLATARTLASNAPLSISAIKIMIEHRHDSDQIAKAIEKCSNSNDSEEGRKAFQEKRAPHFRGC